MFERNILRNRKIKTKKNKTKEMTFYKALDEKFSDVICYLVEYGRSYKSIVSVDGEVVLLKNKRSDTIIFCPLQLPKLDAFNVKTTKIFTNTFERCLTKFMDMCAFVQLVEEKTLRASGKPCTWVGENGVCVNLYVKDEKPMIIFNLMNKSIKERNTWMYLNKRKREFITKIKI